MEKEKFRDSISVRYESNVDGFVRPVTSRYTPRPNVVEVYKGEPLPHDQTQAATQLAPILEEQLPAQSQQVVIQPTYRSGVELAPTPEPEVSQVQTSSLINMALPGEDSGYKSKLVIKKSIMPAIRTWAFRSASAAMVVTLLVGGLLVFQSYMTLHKVLRGGSKTVAALQTNVDPNLLKGEGDGRINILLLGRGGGNHDGPDLTDTMMLASIDPVNKSMSLVSIPRDLWVDIPNQGAMKINAAWESGEFNYEGKIAPGSTNTNAISAGYSEVDQVVENVLGVTINYNMIADFNAFQQAVDTLGGITINVPSELYDPTMAWQNNNNPVLAQPGWQTFSGSQALNYVRSRETTTDFARAIRQRAMMVAIKQKAETLGVVSNPLKIAGLFKAFGNNVDTDISLSDADKLYNIVSGIQSNNITSVGLADAPNHYITTGGLNGQSIDLPAAGMFNYSAIQNFIRGQLKDPYITKENAQVLVVNGTNEPSLGETEAATLESYGYNVIGTETAPTTNYEQTMVVNLSGTKDKYTDHYLEQRFNTTAINTLPDNSIQTNGAAFVIILGNDETVNSQG